MSEDLDNMNPLEKFKRGSPLNVVTPGKPNTILFLIVHD